MKKVSVKLFNVLFLMLSMSFIFTSCSNDANDKSEHQASDDYKDLVFKSGLWFYYSFEQDKFVGEGKAGNAASDAEWKKRTDWDIALHRDNVKINCGTSGDGQGGIFMTDTEDFDAVKEVPEGAKFVVDQLGEKINLTLPEKKQAPKMVETSINMIPNKWVHGQLEPDHHVHFVIDKKKVFIVKTAKGKYAKIQFEGFKGKQSRPDYLDVKIVDIRYAFQKDGSTKF